jgi:hypothetical protein
LPRRDLTRVTGSAPTSGGQLPALEHGVANAMAAYID